MIDEPDLEGNGARNPNDHRELVTVLLWSIRQGWAELGDLLKTAEEYDIQWPEEDEDSVFEEETEQERAMRVLCPETWSVYQWAKAYDEDPQSILDKFSGVSINASDAEEAEEYDSWGNGYDQDLEFLLDKFSGVSSGSSDGEEAEEYDW